MANDNFCFFCKTDESKPVKQEVSGTVILPPLVFPGLDLRRKVQYHSPPSSNSFRSVAFYIENIFYLCHKTSYLHVEVYCTELSLLDSFHWLNNLIFFFVHSFLKGAFTRATKTVRFCLPSLNFKIRILESVKRRWYNNFKCYGSFTFAKMVNKTVSNSYT